MSNSQRAVDSSDGISSQSVARLLLVIGFLSLTFVIVVIAPAEIIVTAIILSFLLVIVYLLWSLSRSVKKLNRRFERIEDELND
jgi:Flp pilus assembly protein TadB